MKRLLVLPILIVGVWNCLVWSQDRVVLRTSSESGSIVVPGDVIEFTGREITIRPRTGAEPKRFPAEQVLSIETTKVATHARAELLYSQQDVAAAEAAFETAMREEPRAWVRREILADLVRCALWRGDSALAGSRFLLLHQSDASTPHFPLIPLAWTPDPVEGEARNHALLWLSEPAEVARLLGASLLLEDREKAGTTQATLKDLVASSDVRVRTLARTQQWRLRLHAESLSSLETDHWARDIESMPESLRAGPYYLLGRAHVLRREFEQAATAFLWLPLVYDRNAQLAARAGFEAAEALDAMGQKKESVNMYREIASRFRQTEFAQRAESRLKLTPSDGDTVRDPPSRP